jgi:hypothetical protein
MAAKTEPLPKGNPSFEKWSARWKLARKNIGNYNEILNLWAEKMPLNWQREDLAGAFGFRKNTKEGIERGEQKIEKQLFAPEHQPLTILHSTGRAIGEMDALYHNMPLANQKRGQVLADAFGVIRLGKQCHPVMIEVKVTNATPWYALVENLLQVRLARACESRIRAILYKKWTGAIGRGVWGIVLAPTAYFNHPNLPACHELLQHLKGKPQARVAFAISDDLAKGSITILHSNWL